MGNHNFNYLIQTKHFVGKRPLYKIGKTTINIFDRLVEYHDGYRLLEATEVTNCTEAENELKAEFTARFVLVKCYGQEIFMGKESVMRRVFRKVTNKYISKQNDIADPGNRKFELFSLDKFSPIRVIVGGVVKATIRRAQKFLQLEHQKRCENSDCDSDCDNSNDMAYFDSMIAGLHGIHNYDRYGNDTSDSSSDDSIISNSDVFDVNLETRAQTIGDAMTDRSIITWSYDTEYDTEYSYDSDDAKEFYKQHKIIRDCIITNNKDTISNDGERKLCGSCAKLLAELM